MNKRENQRPPGAADWHARMALRGGPVTHALARAGALLFAFAGALVMLGVVVLYAANPGEEAMDNSVAANVVGGIVVFVPIGAVGLGLIGLAAQYAARSWLRTPTEAERRAARDAEARTARFAREGLRPEGRWARSFETCARSVTAFHAVVGTLPEGAARSWFADIGETLDGELSEALRLARLGESLQPGDTGEPSATSLKSRRTTACRGNLLRRDHRTGRGDRTGPSRRFRLRPGPRPARHARRAGAEPPRRGPHLAPPRQGAAAVKATFAAVRRAHLARRLAPRAGSAVNGSSGHGCFG
ncbi:hypothetical protein DI005_35145 [Prauserella sp. PE36]|nr:hypothetical protein DI005_35145 [Prauserella sp. PE36]